MKKFILPALALMAAASLTLLTSCSDSNDVDLPVLSTPEYKADAAKYTLADNPGQIVSIELTSSGNYILSLDGATVPFSVGKFTTSSNSVYTLDNGATVAVKEGSVEVGNFDGLDFTASAVKAQALPSSRMTDDLCRSWHPAELGFEYEVGDNVIFKALRPVSKVSDLVADFVESLNNTVRAENKIDSKEAVEITNRFQQIIPDMVIFTESGTLAVVYPDKSLAVASWVWADEDDGDIFCHWVYGEDVHTALTRTADVNFFAGALLMEQDFENNTANPPVKAELNWGFRPIE